LAIEAGNRFFRIVHSGHLHKGKSTGGTSASVGGHPDGGDSTISCEHSLNFAFSRLKRQIANKYCCHSNHPAPVWGD
jgi:hypothetical protein